MVSRPACGALSLGQKEAPRKRGGYPSSGRRTDFDGAPYMLPPLRLRRPRHARPFPRVPYKGAAPRVRIRRRFLRPPLPLSLSAAAAVLWLRSYFVGDWLVWHTEMLDPRGQVVAEKRTSLHLSRGWWSHS